MRVFLCVLLLLGGCGDDAVVVRPLSVAPDELTVITYNMFYGLSSDLLPEDLRTGSLSASASAIMSATSLTDFRCRIDAAGTEIAAEKPDVIGVQEALLISYTRDLDDRSDDTPLVDFLAELSSAIERAGGPKYQVFQRDNAVLQDSLPLVGGIRIGDRGAILVHPRLPAKLAGSITYQALQRASEIGGSGGVVVRGALHVQVNLGAGGLDLYSTHLQSSNGTGRGADVRSAQAAELASYIESTRRPGSTVVLTGDLNDVPGSPTYAAFASQLTDTYGKAGAPPGFTAYQVPPTLDNPVDTASLRIDYVFAETPLVEDSRLILNARVQPCELWPSDHFAVVSRFRTAASRSPTRPLE